MSALQTGALAALAAALLWAVATVLYRRIGRTVGAAELNLLKGLLAIAFLLAAIAIRGDLGSPLAARGVSLLLLSGALGIGIGDTAYFESLRHLGSRLALLLGMLAPPLAGLIAFAALGERLAAASWLGIGIVVAGVSWVVAEQSPSPGRGRAQATPRQAETGLAQAIEGAALRRGVAFGIFAALMQAAGAVLSRAALVETGIDVYWSALLRLAAGGVLTIGWLALRRQRPGAWVRGPGAAHIGLTLLVAAFLGTFICLVLQQTALKHASAGIAQTLIATSPIFVLPLAALARERVTARAVVGALIALGGVALLFGIGAR